MKLEKSLKTGAAALVLAGALIALPAAAETQRRIPTHHPHAHKRFDCGGSACWDHAGPQRHHNFQKQGDDASFRLLNRRF